MINFIHRGDFKNVLNFLNRAPKVDYQRILDNYGAQGVAALKAATPVDTGVTQSSWRYSTRVSRGRCSITWTNSSSDGGAPIVILLHYGHGTRGGGYVFGRDFINPALRPIFHRIAEAVWQEVKAL